MSIPPLGLRNTHTVNKATIEGHATTRRFFSTKSFFYLKMTKDPLKRGKVKRIPFVFYICVRFDAYKAFQIKEYHFRYSRANTDGHYNS
jgi:hypothetical protein